MPARTVCVDGSEEEWNRLAAKTFPLDASPGACSTDLRAVRVLMADQSLYVLMQTACSADLERHLRWYVNLDLDGDQVADLPPWEAAETPPCFTKTGQTTAWSRWMTVRDLRAHCATR